MSHRDHSNCDCAIRLPSGITRRDVLKYSLAGAGIVALGPIGKFSNVALGAASGPVSAKRLVVINMYGGCDTMNMFVPISSKTGSSTYIARRTSVAGNIFVDTSTSPALGGPYATSDYAFHPVMKKIAALWNEGSVAAIPRTGYPNANLSHFESQDIFSTCVRNGFGGLGQGVSGWLARFTDHLPSATAMSAVGLGVGRPLDFSGGALSPTAVASLSAFKINGTGASDGNSRIYRTQQAKDLLARFSGTGLTQESRNALDDAYQLTSQVQASIAGYSTSVTFPAQFISQRMKDAATLIQGGFETRIFYTGFGGFDTHGSQGGASGSLAGLLQQLDDAVGAFAQDMKIRGLWNDVAIVIITEFGRRNYVNGSAGTDHGHGFTTLVIGGAVHGGVIGPGITAADISSEYPAYAIDFRSVYKNVFQNHMNVDPAPIFPEAFTAGSYAVTAY